MGCWNKKRTSRENKGNLNKEWTLVNDNISVVVHKKMVKVKNCQPIILYPMKIPSRNEDKDIPNEGKFKGIHSQQTCFIRVSKGSSLDRREMVPEGNLEHQK